MSIGALVLIILLIALLGGFRDWGGRGPFYGTGYYGGGGQGWWSWSCSFLCWREGCEPQSVRGRSNRTGARNSHDRFRRNASTPSL
jgi:hypothetical protein